LPLFIKAPTIIFFCPVRPNVAMDDQAQNLIWIRGWMAGLRWRTGRDVCPRPHSAGFPNTTETGSIIDGGYGRPLVPTLFDGAGWFTLDDNGRTPLHPRSRASSGAGYGVFRRRKRLFSAKPSRSKRATLRVLIQYRNQLAGRSARVLGLSRGQEHDQHLPARVAPTTTADVAVVRVRVSQNQ
jgi:hypothetical protein